MVMVEYLCSMYLTERSLRSLFKLKFFFYPNMTRLLWPADASRCKTEHSWMAAEYKINPTPILYWISLFPSRCGFKRVFYTLQYCPMWTCHYCTYNIFYNRNYWNVLIYDLYWIGKSGNILAKILQKLYSFC